MPPQKHALITGGSRGIGLAIAHLLASKSYTCTLLSRSAPSLQSAISSLPFNTNVHAKNPHSYIAGDITSPSFWRRESFDEKMKENGGKIDVLVNNAGITQKGLFARMGEEEINQIISTNLTSMMNGTRFLLRGRYLNKTTSSSSSNSTSAEEGEEQKAQSPVIINISSLLGLHGGHGAVGYSASKAGVLGFTRALALETGAMGIRVNAIVPGYIETDMVKDLNTLQNLSRIPLRRFGTVKEVAHAALFLVENQYAHNCVLNLDGGLSAV